MERSTPEAEAYVSIDNQMLMFYRTNTQETDLRCTAMPRPIKTVTLGFLRADFFEGL